jgi:NADH-quinone oxidoreductase subunit N
MAIKLLINFTVILILLSSNYYLVNRSNSNVETPLLILLATLFLLILVSAFNLFTAFMCIIGFSIILYVLILSDVADHAQREASIKYYYLSVYSSGFLIFGIFLVFLITQSLNYTNIKVFIHNFMLAVNSGILDFNNASIVIVLLTISLISLLIGILFKLAAFPCHF